MGPVRRVEAMAMVLAAMAALLPSRGEARELYWRSLDVEARLAEDGSLWIVEEHSMVFDGDWNGGERTFRLGPGQRVELRGIARTDRGGGGRVELLQGDLAQVDRYDWTDGTTVRWRSRLPSDPPFSAEEITYVLDYRLTGVLRPAGDGTYTLDHDFAFPDRFGAIERFRLDLAVDPAFQPEDELPSQLEREALAPGESVVLTARLRYRGEGRPAAAPPPPAAFALRGGSIAAMVAAIAWAFARFRRRERALGRARGRQPQPPELDRAWLEERLLALSPEEVGALWDRRVGPPEVAALLARLVAEGKLEGEPVPRRGRKQAAAKENLRLRLLTGRDTFVGHERELIDKLFFGGREEVTTGQLRSAYQRTGFDPAAIVRPGIEARLARRADTAPGGRAKPSHRPAAVLFLAAAALLALELVTDRVAGLAAIATAVFTLPWTYGLGAALAAVSRRQVEYLDAWTVAFAVPVLALAGGIARALVAPELGALAKLVGFGGAGFPAPGLAGTLGLVLLPIAAAWSLTSLGASREGPAAIALRQQLLQARRHLEAELDQAQPSLDDRWFPYLLALGLAGAVDRWSVRFAAPAGTAAAGGPSGSFGGGSGAGWTGGGGRFGGAGASASWAAAVTGMATGVAAPSSSGGSSGGGGGGGGGGSSGGGGGGGW